MAAPQKPSFMQKAFFVGGLLAAGLWARWYFPDRAVAPILAALKAYQRDNGFYPIRLDLLTGRYLSRTMPVQDYLYSVPAEFYRSLKSDDCRGNPDFSGAGDPNIERWAFYDSFSDSWKGGFCEPDNANIYHGSPVAVADGVCRQ